jgi:flavin reductase (DIM6/NTAB) family NADH-FMN oxidoreductase RutF
MTMKTFTTSDSFEQNYKFLIGSILPRPIAIVSTVNDDGTNNLAPFSFFTAVSASPMIIAFSPLIRSSTGSVKDTPKNILRDREFVINFGTADFIDQINLASTELPYGEDEFAFSGLTPIDSDVVTPKRVKEFPIHFECRFRDTLVYGEGIGGGQIITGEVLRVHVCESIYDQGRISTDLYKPVGRGAGNDWILCTDRVQKERLMKAQIQK